MTPGEFEHLDDDQLARLIAAAQEERLQRALAAGDPETLLRELMDRRGFGPGGDPRPPVPLPGGLIGLTGRLQYTNNERRHRCILYTIRLAPDEDQEWWFWDSECPAYVTHETGKVNTVRATGAILLPPPGARLTQHTMEWAQGRHTRKQVRSWTLEPPGEGEQGVRVVPLSAAAAGRLPPPPGSEE